MLGPSRPARLLLDRRGGLNEGGRVEEARRVVGAAEGAHGAEGLHLAVLADVVAVSLAPGRAPPVALREVAGECRGPGGDREGHDVARLDGKRLVEREGRARAEILVHLEPWRLGDQPVVEPALLGPARL